MRARRWPLRSSKRQRLGWRASLEAHVFDPDELTVSLEPVIVSFTWNAPTGQAAPNAFVSLRSQGEWAVADLLISSSLERLRPAFSIREVGPHSCRSSAHINEKTTGNETT